MTIRLIVIEGSPLIHLGLQELLQRHTDFTLIGHYSNAPQLLAHLPRLPADMLLLSDSIGQTEYQAALQWVTQHYPQLKVVLLASTFSPIEIEAWCQRGVLGFFYRDDPLVELLPTALRSIFHNGLYLSPSVAHRLVTAQANREPHPLNARQMQVLRLMSRYMTPQEIAQALSTTPSSIYGLQYRIRLILGVRTSAQILMEAIKRGWLEISQM